MVYKFQKIFTYFTPYNKLVKVAITSTLQVIELVVIDVICCKFYS